MALYASDILNACGHNIYYTHLLTVNKTLVSRLPMLSYNDSLFTKSRTQAVAVCLSLKACFVTKVMVRVISDALSTRFVAGMVTKCAERSSCCTFRHPFSLPSMCVCPCAHACMRVCVLICVCPWPHVWCGVLYCVLLSPPQSVINWNSVLLWVDYEATEWAVWNMTIDTETGWKSGLIVCCGCPIENLVWLCVVDVP